MSLPYRDRAPYVRSRESVARSIAKRFFVAANGCWQWTGAFDDDGYGRLTAPGWSNMAHRVVYMLMVGPIEDGLELDHRCRNTACVNPVHLEPVTTAVNQARIPRPATCRRGHALVDNKHGTGRFCRECTSQRHAALYRTNPEYRAKALARHPSTRSNKCSLCGCLGHNRRTCGELVA